jgi:uncharacterized protein YycO
MKLLEVAEQIQTGDIFLCRGSVWWGAKIIRLKTQSVYSHVGVAIWITADSCRRLAILEATYRGVRMFPLDLYLVHCQRWKTQVDWWVVTDSSINREKIASYCLKQWGKPYASLWQLFWSFGWLGSLFRKCSGFSADLEKDRFFCSELVASALRAAGWVPPPGDPSDREPALTDPGVVALFPCLQRRGRLEL